MRKLVLTLTTILMVSALSAQSNKEEVDLLQAAFGMEKKAMVGDFVNPDASKQEAFWMLYDEYEAARKELGVERIALLKKYAETYNSMTNEASEAWMKDVIKLGKASDKLVVTYYNKVKKATDAMTAFRFYHIENYILTSIRLSLLEDIPFPKAK